MERRRNRRRRMSDSRLQSHQVVLVFISTVIDLMEREWRMED